ncbi:hypothetical protein GTY87_18795 [Streptomyces sp. SID7813]|uniref:Uncharacterized protein n=1 Tax=Streptomyces coelicolor (strain ATCC BAA-471 / A3(2) / M145) TaxID=100226 RepID=Q9X8W2_STRCO|nr:hypothetical protein [Streptomyces sp. SID7813]QFI47840.1 hypothetical protein FQ762_18950 [Streptomyces coelicolor A3(2)]CAB44383.1 hypothetical protein [Streptomyces coelicolor A3(2)]
MGCPPVRQGTAADGSRALSGSAGRGRWDPGAGGRAWPLLPEESADDRSEFAGGESAGVCGAEGGDLPRDERRRIPGWSRSATGVPDALGLVSLLPGA